jgi:hypothetical protein
MKLPNRKLLHQVTCAARDVVRLTAGAIRKEKGNLKGEEFGFAIWEIQSDADDRHEDKGGGCTVRLEGTAEIASFQLVEALQILLRYGNMTPKDVEETYGLNLKAYRLSDEDMGRAWVQRSLANDLRQLERWLKKWQQWEEEERQQTADGEPLSAAQANGDVSGDATEGDGEPSSEGELMIEARTPFGAEGQRTSPFDTDANIDTAD